MNLGTAAAMFHLTTHAFFKALLFLGSGAVIHACHHEQDIFRLGGLRKKLPVTFVTFTIGYLALMGLPYVTAGFYSKDLILFLAYQKMPVLFGLLCLGAFLTAFYMTRLWAITFFGEARSEGAAHAHENGPLITVPMMVLAVLSIVGGFTFLYPSAFSGVIDTVRALEESLHEAGTAHGLIVGVSFAAILFAGLAWWYYKPGAAADRLEAEAKGLHRVLEARLYWDRFYAFLVAKVQQPVAEALLILEQFLISGLGVHGVAAVSGVVGLGLKALHVGNVRAYLLWFFAGVAGLWFLLAGA
jgi:NADH-quinone oxidoreductase subunit L